ncbi:hypothetical protein HDU90_005362 [Geranomyces variabilis]|nr:hypothetical protein HDU90_005362 [Geranomyces variabilis]
MRGYTMYAARDGLFVADKMSEMDLPKPASDLPALGHEIVKCLLLNVKSRIVGPQRYFAAECSKARAEATATAGVIRRRRTVLAETILPPSPNKMRRKD